MTTVLIGGGWSDPGAVYGPFLAAAGSTPRVACVVLDEGDGAEQAARWQNVLRTVAPCDPRAVLVPLGEPLDPAALAEADAVLVCGGLTPAYADSLAPCAAGIRDHVAAGRPYAGFSAGAAVAARRAVVGGYRLGGRVVCPEDAGEDLEEITVVDGLGLIEVSIDVHAAQWGTLGRLSAAVGAGLVARGVAIDEDTALVIAEGTARVVGRGAVHVVDRAESEGITLRCVTAGDHITLPGAV